MQKSINFLFSDKRARAIICSLIEVFFLTHTSAVFTNVEYVLREQNYFPSKNEDQLRTAYAQLFTAIVIACNAMKRGGLFLNFLVKSGLWAKKIVFDVFEAFLRHFVFSTIIDNFSSLFRRYVQPRKYFRKIENLTLSTRYVLSIHLAFTAKISENHGFQPILIVSYGSFISAKQSYPNPTKHTPSFRILSSLLRHSTWKITMT